MGKTNISVTDANQERVYSIDTAAELLAVSPWTIRKWVADRKITSAKLGARRVIPASEIKRIITESLVERTA